MDPNIFHATKTKDPQPSCDAMLTMPTLANPSPFLQDPTMHSSYSPLSLEVAPCKEESKKAKAINVNTNQDQAPLHILQDVTSTYHFSYPNHKYDEDTTSTTSI